MPTATRTFRVFVSSTFEDLKAERDALQREVFPRLRKLCEESGARFQAIDLRWGVRDEAALDQQTMEICLREIERCQQTGIKPNFIVLLGERYGWRPLSARIEAGEFEKVCDQVKVADKLLIDDWYERDDNAVPPEYLLKARTSVFADKGRWEEVEQELHRILREAAREAGLAAEELIKYEASATHQEILKGLGQSKEDRRHVFAFCRDVPDEKCDPELADLRRSLKGQLAAGNVIGYEPDDLAGLCMQVEETLSAVITNEAAGFKSKPALELEIEAHDRFAADRSRIFVGRADALTAIADYLSGPERRPLVLHGESGSGKSAVMAVASQQYKGQGRLIRRFIGASPESASGHALLTSICKQIAPVETPVDYYQLEKALQERLATATAEASLVLFIDALDQLSASDPAREARWLPAELPPHVKVIVSTTDDGERLPTGLPVRLERLTTAEGGLALDELLRGVDPRERRRTLQPWQREFVLAHFERCGLPLYLKLAAEESRLWKSFFPPDSCALGEGIAGVLDTLFDRLASNANHGAVLVERSLGYLAAARYGLTEGEMLDVLAEDDAVWNDFDQRKHHEVSERRLPVVVWSRLSLDLEPYLTERAAPGGTVTAFYHRQLAERVSAKFLVKDEAEARHIGLARHFLAEPAWLDESRKTPNARRSVELVFQQREARQWKAAEATLLDCPFLFAKCASGQVLDLDSDYEALFKDAPPDSLFDRRTVELIHGALLLSVHVLAHDPRQFAGQMVGRLLPHEEMPAIGGFIEQTTSGLPRPWLRPLHLALVPPGGPLIRTLEGHSSDVNGVAVTPDGRLAVSASRDHTLKVWDLETGRELRTLEGHSSGVNGVAVTPDGRCAVSASGDETLRVWNLETGRELHTLEGRSGSVNGIAMTPDGRRVVSAGDFTLKVWDLETGLRLLTLKGHADWVHGLAVTPDGRRALSTSHDKTLKVWDLESGRELHSLEGHSDTVRDVAVTPDGKRAVSASEDKTLKVWDLETGRELRTLEGHSFLVTGVAVTPDGRRAVSASWDNTLKVWDLESGRELHSLEGHSDTVTGLAVTPDGRRAVSASGDKTLKVWDLETGHSLHTMDGHSRGVYGVAVTSDGRRVVSASDDRTLKVWDLETGRELRTMGGLPSLAIGLAVTPDGRRAVSASHDNMLKVWDLETGRELRTLESHSSLVTGVAVTPDGRRADSASWDNTMKAWDLAMGRERLKMGGSSSLVIGLAVTPDGRRAVSASWDNSLKVWNLDTGCELRTLEGHSGLVAGVAVTPDGRRAVSASWDNTMKVWNLDSGRELMSLEGHSNRVAGAAVYADGRRAISASSDRTLKVWDLETGAEIAAFTCDAGATCCAAIDDRQFVAGDAMGRLHWLELVE